MGFGRNGFDVAMSCGGHDTTIEKGRARYSGRLDRDCLDKYYLFSMAVFNPEGFAIARNSSISIQSGSQDEAETLATTEVRSPTRVLHFGRDDGLLRRVSCMHKGQEYVRIDFSQHVKVDSTMYPTTIRTTFLNKDMFPANHLVPNVTLLEIDPKTIDTAEAPQ
jgi:hypothetical protein